MVTASHCVGEINSTKIIHPVTEQINMQIIITSTESRWKDKGEDLDWPEYITHVDYKQNISQIFFQQYEFIVNQQGIATMVDHLQVH